jgi:hypothetical protein
MVFGGDISAIAIAKVEDGTEDIAEVDLTSAWFVPSRNVGKVNLPYLLNVVA